MAFLYGGGREKSRDPLREYAHSTRGGVRQTEREIGKLDTQEASLLKLIRKLGLAGQVSEATERARELVRLRAHRQRLRGLRSNLLGLAQELSEMSTAQKTTQMVAKATGMLQTLDRQMDTRATYKLVNEYASHPA